jgi:outer membrane protein
MRFDQRISTCVRLLTAGAVVCCLSVSGRAVSAIEQAAQAPTPPKPAPQTTAAAPTTLRITADEAVRMALENNLGVHADRLSPQIETYGVAQAKAAYAPTLTSLTTTRSATQPPSDFLTGNTNVLTNESFRTNAGIRQLAPWGGGLYTVGIDAGRLTSSNPTNTFNPSLDSNFAASYTQPLLRGFTIDTFKQNVLISENRQEQADIQLRQTLTQTSRSVRNAYFDLVNAIGQLQVSQGSLDLARQSLRNNQRRVEVGSLAPIELLQAEAEVARNEEQVIVAEGQIQGAQDRLRILVMNPSQPDFWTTVLEPAERPTLTPQPIDVEMAISNALQNRTDVAQFRKQIEQTDISMKFLKNQKLPALDVTGNYNLIGTAGTQRQFDNSLGIFPPPIIRESQRSFGSALRDVFANEFKTWSVQLNVSYPLGTSIADAGLAQARLQREQQNTNLRELETQIVAQVREAGRQVTTSLKRVESTRKARELAEQNLQAEEKRAAVGLSDTFRVFQAQRDLATQRNNELNAIIAYNRSLIAFEAIQSVPPGGNF